MLPLKNRLKKTKDFEKVFRQGFYISDGFITLKVAKNNLEVTRFGFIVGTKISKKAVVRNKIKRWLRAAVFPDLKNIKPGFDVAVMVKPEVLSSSFKEIKNIVEKLISKLNNLDINSQKQK